jgi:hypothetical protein
MSYSSDAPPRRPLDTGCLLGLGLLLIFALTAIGLVWIVRDTIQASVRPIDTVTGSVATRVAQALNPTPTILPDPITIIQGVRSLARLETIQYTVEKVITAESGQGTLGFLFGDKLIFVAHGVVIAGVDLDKLQPSDLRVQDGVLYVTLPDAEVFAASLDNDKSYVYDRNVGALTKGSETLETDARRAAEAAIRSAAEEDGILRLARDNAESYLYRLFLSLGFSEVIFTDRDTPLPLAATATVAPFVPLATPAP